MNTASPWSETIAGGQAKGLPLVGIHKNVGNHVTDGTNQPVQEVGNSSSALSACEYFKTMVLKLFFEGSVSLLFTLTCPIQIGSQL